MSEVQHQPQRHLWSVPTEVAPQERKEQVRDLRPVEAPDAYIRLDEDEDLEQSSWMLKAQEAESLAISTAPTLTRIERVGSDIRTKEAQEQIRMIGDTAVYIVNLRNLVPVDRGTHVASVDVQNEMASAA